MKRLIKMEDKSFEIKANLSLMTEGEKKYKLFCDNKEITVFYLHQSPSSFSKEIKKMGGKRPDFHSITIMGDFYDFHSITIMGDFYVDVKSSKLNRYPKFTLGLEDFKKLSVSQKILKRPILIAFPIDPWQGEDWGFISLSHLKHLKEKQKDLIEKGYRWIGVNYSNLKKFEEILNLLI